MRLLLHACCGPCLLEPFDALSADYAVTACYANPNIAPADEYHRRRDTLAEYASTARISWFELSYSPDSWRLATRGLDRPWRCRACYELRLGLVATEAAARGFDAVATTLTVSPYQDVDSINSVGELVCSSAGVAYVKTDFRERYGEATRRSRELGMYRQNYCGCLLSKTEAEADRAAQRARRRARKA